MTATAGNGEGETFDVVVLGAGSGGENLAAQLSRRGLQVAVVEQRLVGGECPYFACMPSKAMLHHAKAGRSWEDAVAHRDDVADGYDDTGHVRDLDEAGVALLRGRGRFDGPGRVTIEADDGTSRTVEAEHLVLATGSFEPGLPVEGAEDIEVWDSETAWTTPTRPDRLLVVGGGPVGAELATAYAMFGSQVVLVERERRLLGKEDAAVADRVADALRAKGVEVLLGTEVARLAALDGGTVRIDLDDGSARTVDRVIAALGKQPRTNDIGLETLGLDPDNLEVGLDGRVDGAPNVWAIGDVSGHPPFTHAANALADVIAHNLRGADQTRLLDVDVMPRATFVDPPVGAVGSTAPDVDHVRVQIDLADTARGTADDVQHGLAVLAVRRQDRRLAGFCIVSPGGDELVLAATVAMRAGMRVDDLRELVAPFPTYAEVLPLLAGRAADQLDAHEKTERPASPPG